MVLNKHIVNKHRLLIDQTRVLASALFCPNVMTSLSDLSFPGFSGLR